jgi:hypothetical protein
MKKAMSLCGLVLGALFLTAGTAGAAPTLSFTPSSSHINVGDSVVIEATVSGLGAEILSAYDLNFTYDAALLNWGSITQFSAPFNVNFTALSGFDNNVEGDLGFFLNSLDSDPDLVANQPDSFVIFQFQLQGMTDGVANFTLGADLDFERNFVGLNGNSLQVAVGSACIAVGTGQCAVAVPEPGSLALIALGLVAAGGAGRRRPTV